MTTLRWGFLGASRIGGGALAPAVRAAGHELLAVSARDVGRARAFAERYGVTRAYGSYEEMLADPDVDLVYNALPNDAHLPLTVAALRAGKHVLCEKPLTLDATEVEQIAAVEAETGRMVLEAFSYRFHPQVTRARDLVREGALGDVRLLRASFCFDLDRPDDFRWTPEKGGGGLYDVGCYCVNAMRLVTGLEPLRAAAFEWNVGGVDATLSGVLDFGAGVTGHFDCGMKAAHGQSFEVVGSTGILRLSRPYSSKGTETTLTLGDRTETFEPMDPYAEMVAHFGRAAQGQEALLYPISDALAQMRTLDALRVAAREGRVVAL